MPAVDLAGGSIVGVRIAVRDTIRPGNSQIYNWGIKKEAPLAAVVLWADAFPPVGILMIPKTCAYVWVVLMGREMTKADAAAPTAA